MVVIDVEADAALQQMHVEIDVEIRAAVAKEIVNAKRSTHTGQDTKQVIVLVSEIAVIPPTALCLFP